MSYVGGPPRKAMRPKNIMVRAGVWVLVAIPFYTFSSMAIAGAATTTPGMENIFIAQIAPVGTKLDGIGALRFGYVGLCAFVGNQGANGPTFGNTNGFECIGKPYSQTKDEMSTTLHVSESLIELGQRLQNDITIFMPAVALVLFMIGFFLDTFSWLWAGLGRPVGITGTLAMPFLWAAVATSLGAAYTLTVAVNSIRSVLTDSTVGCSDKIYIEQGKALEALEWLSFAFALAFAAAIYAVSRDNMYGFGIASRPVMGGRRQSSVGYNDDESYRSASESDY